MQVQIGNNSAMTLGLKLAVRRTRQTRDRSPSVRSCVGHVCHGDRPADAASAGKLACRETVSPPMWRHREGRRIGTTAATSSLARRLASRRARDRPRSRSLRRLSGCRARRCRRHVVARSVTPAGGLDDGRPPPALALATGSVTTSAGPANAACRCTNDQIAGDGGVGDARRVARFDGDVVRPGHEDRADGKIVDVYPRRRVAGTGRVAASDGLQPAS